MEEKEFTTPDEKKTNEIFALIIYDIIDNKRRKLLVKYLQGYGFRVQKSCFEVILNKTLFKKLKAEIGKYATDEDSIRIYQINGSGQVTCYGNTMLVVPRDIIIV